MPIACPLLALNVDSTAPAPVGSFVVLFDTLLFGWLVLRGSSKAIG